MKQKKTTQPLWQPFHLKVILYKAFKLLVSFFLSHSSIFLLFPLRPVGYSVKSSGICNLHIISLFFYVPFSIIIWVYMWVCVCVQWEIWDQSGDISQVSCLRFGDSVIKLAQNQTNNNTHRRSNERNLTTHRTVIWHTDLHNTNNIDTDTDDWKLNWRPIRDVRMNKGGGDLFECSSSDEYILLPLI